MSINFDHLDEASWRVCKILMGRIIELEKELGIYEPPNDPDYVGELHKPTRLSEVYKNAAKREIEGEDARR